MGSTISAVLPEPYADRATGERRREGRVNSHFLPSKPSSPLLPPDKAIAKMVDIDTGVVDLSTGKCFWMTVTPVDFSRVNKVVVFIHGLGDHVGSLYQNELLMYAHEHGVACIGLDMPGHGRSDGLFMYIDGWFNFVGWAEEFCDTVVPEKVKEWSNRLGGKRLKVFGQGVSLGGGVLATMCLRSPERFEGVVLVSPMLAIEDGVRPHPAVEFVLKNVVGPLLPTVPMTLGESSLELLMHDAEMAKELFESNEYGGDGRLRLQTAIELGIVACPWITERLSEFRTPFLVMHAGDDRVTSPDASRRLHEIAASTDKTIKIVEGAWHAEVFVGVGSAEPQRAAFQFVADWLEARA